MTGFLDSTVEADFSALPSPHSVQTLDFIKKLLKGIRYVDLSVSTRTVTGQVKNGDGTNVTSVVSVNIKSDQVVTVNIGTLVTTGNSSIQINTNASGVFQVTIAGSQGATVEATPVSGVSSTVLVGSGGTGGGGGGGISGINAKDEGTTITGGPFTTFNFTGAGVTASDAGSGQLNVAISGGGAGTGSLSISDAALDSNPNLSTEGTVDWFAIVGSTNPMQTLGTTGRHSKIKGGWIFDTFTWVFAGQSMTQDTTTVSNRTSTASDDVASTALNSAVYGRMFSLSSPGTGWGFTFKIPVKAGKTWTIKIRTNQFSCVMKHTAELLDGVTPEATVNTDSGSGAGLSRLITITVTPNKDCELFFRTENLSRYTADPNVSVGSISVGGSF